MKECDQNKAESKRKKQLPRRKFLFAVQQKSRRSCT